MPMSAIIQACIPPNVSTVTMQQLVTVESANRPFSIGHKLVRYSKDGDGRLVKSVSTLNSTPRSKDEAKLWARYLLDNGYQFDAGVAQINSSNFSRYGLTLDDVFDACTNLRTGAAILQSCYARAVLKYEQPAEALKAALSCYQSNDFKAGQKNGYVDKVLSVDVKGGQ